MLNENDLFLAIETNTKALEKVVLKINELTAALGNSIGNTDRAMNQTDECIRLVDKLFKVDNIGEK